MLTPQAPTTLECDRCGEQAENYEIRTVGLPCRETGYQDREVVCADCVDGSAVCEDCLHRSTDWRWYEKRGQQPKQLCEDCYNKRQGPSEDDFAYKGEF